MKVDVIYGEPENLQAALREWVSQHARARIQAATQSSAPDGSGKIVVTVVIWYQE
jgi:hypothetical protein